MNSHVKVWKQHGDWKRELQVKTLLYSSSVNDEITICYELRNKTNSSVVLTWTDLYAKFLVKKQCKNLFELFWKVWSSVLATDFFYLSIIKIYQIPANVFC